MTSNRSYLIRALIDWIVDNDCTPHALVACEVDGVEVPAEYVRDDRIALSLSATATRNLDIGTDFISADCRFGGRPISVRFPVGAVIGVYAKETGQGMAFEIEQGEPDAPDDDPPKPNGPPKLSLV